ncbi:MAG TPA: acetylxylan esterase [Bryobacteraceae bacterium]|nr:acetylxylan esterase [Bryobacteraceae bacterium]
MTRRDLLSIAAAAALPANAQQAKPKVVGYREYAKCLPDAIRALAAETYKRRVAQIGKLTTPAAIRARQQWARQTFWKLIGGMPDRTPLETRTTGSFEREKYRVEKLVYQSRPGEWISANLYIPKNAQPPFPGVLFQMGHTDNGKAGDTYQRCCQGLAQLGFLVLAFDPMGQGERIAYLRSEGNLTRLPSADDEHTKAGMQMLLVGDSAARMQTWDAVRSLDVLASHPMVDPKRLASTGQSGGATITMFLAAVDDRLACAAVSSGNTENFACANFHPPGSVDDAEQDLVGAGPLGFDRWDLLWPIAPKPLLVLTSAKDSFGTYSPNYEDNGLEEYGRLDGVYRALGKPDHLSRFESPLPHGMSYVMRLETYRWLSRWLQEGRKVDEEPPVAPEPDKMLWATETGSVVRSLNSKTPAQSSRETAASIATPEKPNDLRKLLGIAAPAAKPTLRRLSRVPSRHCEILAVEVPTGDPVWVPAWIFVPKQAARRLLIVADPHGRNASWQEGGLYQRLAAEGTVVCAPDLRGIGDLRPEYSAGSPGYTGPRESETDYAWASLMLGRSLLGQRVLDLLALIEALATAEWGTAPLLAARGQLTVPALCAASLLSKVGGLYLADHLLSWRSLAETENYQHPFANFIPDVLRSTDLPQIAATIAPRKIVLAGVLDGAGKSLTAAGAKRLYTSSNIEIRQEAAWDSDALSSF